VIAIVVVVQASSLSPHQMRHVPEAVTYPKLNRAYNGRSGRTNVHIYPFLFPSVHPEAFYLALGLLHLSQHLVPPPGGVILKL